MFQALLESLDAGKPVADSRGDLDHALTIWRYFAGWADKIHGNTLPIDGSFMSLTRKVGSKILYLNSITGTLHLWQEPVGVCGQITPWNYPVPMASWKMATALAAGCTLILKVTSSSKWANKKISRNRNIQRRHPLQIRILFSPKSL